MNRLKILVSPAALCLWFVALSIGFSVMGSNASRTVVLKQENKFAYAQASFPIQMKRRDEALFSLLTQRANAEMAEFLKSAEDAAARPPPQPAGEEPPAEDAPAWTPYTQASSFAEQFRTLGFVSYLEAASVRTGGQSVIAFRTVNFDKETRREVSLGDILEGAADRSRPLEALAAYARAALRERTGEEGEEESAALIELTKPDLSVYGRFTLCPSTRSGKAAGLTIHFPPPVSGPYEGKDYHITVPYTVFAKFLKPGMKALFAGEPRETEFSLRDAGI